MAADDSSLLSFAPSGSPPIRPTRATRRSAGPRFVVTYGARRERGAARRPPAAALLDGPSAEPRFQISDTSLKTQQVFGIDVDGWKAGRGSRLRGRRARLPAREPGATSPPGTYRVQALLHRYETFHRADGHTVKLPMDRGEGQQWSKAPGNLYSTPREVTIDPAKAETIAYRARPGDPADPGSADHEVRQAREDPERAALEVLGPADVPRRARPAARGLRHAPGRALPARHLPRPLPDTIDGFREEPPDPNLKPDYSERFHLAGYNRIQQEYALPVLQGLDRARLPALAARRDPAREPVLRRLLRGELGEPRPVRRRDHLRADPLPREEVPGARRRLGAVHVRRLDRRLGGARRADVLPRRVQRLLGRPAPTRSTSAPTPW